MTSSEFVQKYYPFALQIEKDTKIPSISILAQAALESGWGKQSIGNNIFGIKFTKGNTGYQKILTTEYNKDIDAYNGKEVVSRVYIPELKKYKFKVYQYFADYKTPYEGFSAHSKLLLSDRYIDALRWTYSPKRYLIAIWRAGYASDPGYGRKMCQMVNSIIKRLPK